MRLLDGLKNLESEFKPMLRLSGPVVLAELGWVTMGIVDTMMVGRVGPEAIGGVSLGSITFFSVAIFGMGLLLGLDTLVSQAFGAGHGRRRGWMGDLFFENLYGIGATRSHLVL